MMILEIFIHLQKGTNGHQAAIPLSEISSKILLFSPSPLVTDPDDGEVHGGQVGPGHEPTKMEGKKKIRSTKEIDSFVCGIQVEDELDAVIENAHKNNNCESQSPTNGHLEGFEDEEECEDAYNAEEIETGAGEISPSQEEDLLFDEVETTVDGEALQEELEPTFIQETDQEVQDMNQEEEVGSRKTSREEEINDSRRFEGKLSRQQELRQSENNEVGRHISIYHLYNSLFRCQSCGPAWTPKVRRWD